MNQLFSMPAVVGTKVIYPPGVELTLEDLMVVVQVAEIPSPQPPNIDLPITLYIV